MDWQALGRRADAIDRWWWHGSSVLDRERARFFAHDRRDMSRELFLSLCAAGVLAVHDEVRRGVQARTCATFPMPRDLCSYVQATSGYRAEARWRRGARPSDHL